MAKYNNYSFMQWFYDLSTKKKMMVLIGVVFIMIASVGITGLCNTRKANAAIDNIIADQVEPLMAVSSIKKNLFLTKGLLLKLTTANTGALLELNTELGKVASNVDNSLSVLKKHEDKLVEVRNFSVKYTKFVQVIDTLKSYANNGLKYKAKTYLHENESIVFELDNLLSSIELDLNNGIKVTQKELEKAATIADIFNIVIVILAVISCVWLGHIASDRIGGILTELREKMESMAKGDLSVSKLGRPEQSDVGALCVVFDTMFQNLKDLVRNVADASNDVTAGVQQVTAATEQVALGAQQVSKTIEHVAASSQQVATNLTQLSAGAEEQSISVTKGMENINNVNKSVKKIIQETEETASLSKSTELNASAGYNLSQDAVVKINEIKTVSNEISGTINELGTLSNNIEEIVDMIKGIASQTNLLALNAAIEAARAGEHGKGFAVVAEEVKSLAGESADATDKITEMIKEIQAKTSDAVNVMNCAIEEVDSGVSIVSNVGNSLEEIVAAAKETNTNVDVITNAVNELANNSNSVVELMQEFAAVTQQSSASTEDISSITQATAANVQEVSASTEEQSASLQAISASMDSVNNAATILQELVIKFKL